MNLEITTYRESDLGDLRKLYQHVRKSNFDWLSESALDVMAFDQDTEGEYILVAKIQNEVVGFVSAWLSDNFIHHLFIHNEYQNKGIGALLLNRMISGLKSPVTLKCMTRNSSAVRFYLKNGWKQKSAGLCGEGEYLLFEYK